jgi:multidrug efflux system outer membrane protein
MPMTASIARPLLALAATLLLVSCAVPPRSERPPLRDEAPLAGVDVPAGGEWPSPDWWTRYDDPQLDRLEELALARSPSLQEAQRRFGAAVQAVDIARAAEGLTGEASAQVQRQRLSEHGLIPSQFLGFTWYNQGDLAVSVRHDFDFWGRSRAAIAASVDEARAAEAERAAAALLLTSAVAETYLAWAADHVRLALAAETVAALERSRAIGARRVARGIDPPDL